MKGLDLSRAYYEACRDTLLAPWPDYRARIAAGLVGHGSECFGFDDDASRDHDFGPDFCLWLRAEDYAAIGAELQSAYEALPRAFAGYPPRRTNARSGKRVGVFSIPYFYAEFLGAPELPISEVDWRQIPEENLACVTNGAVFEDPTGEFSRLRASLLAYYPERLRRLKLAQAVAKMAQSGQYNLPRAVARKEPVTAALAQAEFLRQTCLAAHALNRRFAPFYKWLHASLGRLPRLAELHAMLATLARTRPEEAGPLVEAICARLLSELVSAGLARPGDAFLEAHVNEIVEGFGEL